MPSTEKIIKMMKRTIRMFIKNPMIAITAFTEIMA